MGELVGGGYTLLYVYYLVWYTDLGGRGVFRRLTSLLFKDVVNDTTYSYKTTESTNVVLTFVWYQSPVIYYKDSTKSVAVYVKYNVVFGNIWYIVPTCGGKQPQISRQQELFAFTCLNREWYS